MGVVIRCSNCGYVLDEFTPKYYTLKSMVNNVLNMKKCPKCGYPISLRGFNILNVETNHKKPNDDVESKVIDMYMKGYSIYAVGNILQIGFPKAYTIIKRWRKKNNRKPLYRCPLCGEVMGYIALYKHMRIFHKNTQCPICQSHITLNELGKHLRENHNTNLRELIVRCRL
jgi:transposase-like protein